jgi:hypothetical protein
MAGYISQIASCVFFFESLANIAKTLSFRRDWMMTKSPDRVRLDCNCALLSIPFVMFMLSAKTKDAFVRHNYFRVDKKK